MLFLLDCRFAPPFGLTSPAESFKRQRRRPSARQAAQRAARGARVAVSRTYDDRHHRGRARLPQLDARSSAGSGRCRHSDAVVRARARDTRLRPRPQVPGSPRGASGSTWKGRAVGSDGTRRILQHPSPSCHAHMLTRARVPRPLLIAGPGASAAATAAMTATAARVAAAVAEAVRGGGAATAAARRSRRDGSAQRRGAAAARCSGRQSARRWHGSWTRRSRGTTVARRSVSSRACARAARACASVRARACVRERACASVRARAGRRRACVRPARRVSGARGADRRCGCRAPREWAASSSSERRAAASERRRRAAASGDERRARSASARADSSQHRPRHVHCAARVRLDHPSNFSC